MNKIAQRTQAAAAKKQPSSIKDFIKAYKGEIARALPKVMTPERFSRIAMTAVTQTPKLAECDAGSFIGAMLTAAQLGLEPNTPLGQAYLIPYNLKGVMKCQFQLGYKGLLELAHRSGEIKNIEAHVVYENDDFDFEYGLEPKLKHKPAMSAPGEPVWVYAIYRLNNGGFAFEVMSWEACINHGLKYSKSFGSSSSPWQTDPEGMAKKTVLKRLLKYAPMKTEFMTAAAEDEKTITGVDFTDDGDEAKAVPIEAEYNEVLEDTDATGEDDPWQGKE